MKRSTREGRWLALALLSLCACGYRAGLVDEGFKTRVAVEGISLRGTTTAGGTRIEIFGENFPAGVAVYFGEQRAEVADVSAKRIAVDVPARDEPGVVSVRLVLPDGRSVEALADFRYRAKELRLRFGEELGASGTEAAYGVGDVDGDGRNDLVIAAQQGGGGRLAIHLNGPRGLDSEPVHVTALPAAIDYLNTSGCALPDVMPDAKYDVLTTDLDGDGRAEVAVSLFRRAELLLLELAGDQWRSRTITAPELFADCSRRKLVPLSTDGAPGADVLALINVGSAIPGYPDPNAVPAELGLPDVAHPWGLRRVGYTSIDGSRRGALTAEALGCDRYHSHHVQRRGGGDRLILLCDELTDAGQPRRLKLVELDLRADGPARVASSRTVLDAVTAHQRYYLQQLDTDPALEVISLAVEAQRLTLGQAEIGPGGLVPQDELSYTEDLEESGPPILAVVDAVGDEAAEVLLVWPGGEVSVVGRPGQCTLAVCGAPGGGRTIHLSLLPNRPMLEPDWGTGIVPPPLPTLAFGDLDGDGKPEWITADHWKRTMVAYGSAGGPRALPVWRPARPPEPGFISSPPVIWPVLPATVGGGDRSALVDLDGDGTRDVVYLDLPAALGQPGQRFRLHLGLVGETGKGAARDLVWDLPSVPLLLAPPAFGDLDGDGWTDVLLPTQEADGRPRLDLVRSEGGGLERYRVEPGAVTLSGQLAAVAVLARSARGAGRPRLFTVTRAPEGQRYDVRAFAWDEAKRALVEVALGESTRQIAIEGSPRRIFGWTEDEGDGDGTVRLLVDRGTCAVTLGGASAKVDCSLDCAEPCQQHLLGTPGASSHRVVIDPTRPGEVRWTRAATDRKGEQRVALLAGDSGTFLDPRFHAACDLDGDDEPEIVFSAQLRGQSGPVIGALSWDLNEERVVTRLVGAPAVSFDQVDCLQVDRPGEGRLEDLVLRSWEGAYYLIHNRSR